MDSVPSDCFTVKFSAVMLYGDGYFDEFAAVFRKIGIKAELF